MQEMVQLTAALLGSLGFALLFNMRGEKLLFATLGGGLSWGIYLAAAHLWGNQYLCGFAASVCLTLYAECMARIHKTPVTVFLVAAAIPLIPGAGLYRAMDCLMQKDLQGFGSQSSYTLLFAASMSAGITLTTVIVRMLLSWRRKGGGHRHLLLLCLALLGAGLPVCAGLSGCSGEQEEPAPEDVEYKAFEACTEQKEGQKSVYMILKSCETTYWKKMIQGARTGAEEAGCSLYVGGTLDETNWEIQEKLMTEAVERGADAILLAPIDSSQLAGPAGEIYKKGIPVVLVDTILNSEDYSICYMTDNIQAGEEAAKELLAQMKKNGVKAGEEAQVAVQVGSLTSQTIIDRLAGFSHYWAKHAPEEWVILDDIRCNSGDSEEAAKICRQFLAEYPGLKGVFGCNNGSTAGFAAGLYEAGRTDIAAVGFDYSEEMARLISSGDYRASTLLQKQYEMGRQGVNSALDFLSGGTAPRKFVDTGIILVTPENVSTPDIQRELTQGE